VKASDVEYRRDDPDAVSLLSYQLADAAPEGELGGGNGLWKGQSREPPTASKIAEQLTLVPNLRFRRWIKMPFVLPSSLRILTAKRLSPRDPSPPVRARARATVPSVAEENLPIRLESVEVTQMVVEQSAPLEAIENEGVSWLRRCRRAVDREKRKQSIRWRS
jgi:hypothetical protein